MFVLVIILSSYWMAVCKDVKVYMRKSVYTVTYVAAIICVMELLSQPWRQMDYSYSNTGFNQPFHNGVH